MRPVTIDKLDIKNHERYAKDQQALDTKYITESTAIGNYFEIVGTSTIFASNFENLFELQNRNIPWAVFTPPDRYHLQTNRFFSYQILPSIYVSDEFDEQSEQEKEDEDENENKQKERYRVQFIQKINAAKKGRKQNLSHFESEKSTILSLLESIRHLDKILGQINSRKRQYQKG